MGAPVCLSLDATIAVVVAAVVAVVVVVVVMTGKNNYEYPLFVQKRESLLAGQLVSIVSSSTSNKPKCIAEKLEKVACGEQQQQQKKVSPHFAQSKIKI